MCVFPLLFLRYQQPAAFSAPSVTHTPGAPTQNITMVLMTGTDPTIVTMVLTRQLQFLRDVSASSVTHPPGASLLGLMPAGFKNHLLFKTVQNTPLPFTARMPRRRNKQSGNRILTALRRLRIKIEPRSPVLLILPFKCKQIMKCKRIMKSDMSQYKERVELFSI